jgi:uncharacterized membrane protein YgcG
MGAIAIAWAAPRLGMLTGITYEQERPPQGARSVIDIRLRVKPETRAELERLAALDRRSIAQVASLIVEAALRARRLELTEEASHG